MFGIPYTKQDWIDREIARAAARDPFGHRLHLFWGVVWLVLVPGPISVVQFAVLGLGVTSLMRAYVIHRTWRSFGCHPAFWMILVWLGWVGLSTSWSPNPHGGWLEVAASRWPFAMFLVWSILGHRPVLILALVLGFVGANIAQVIHGVGVALDAPSITFNRPMDRNAGWWQPVVGGSMLTAALGLHLPAAVMGTGWRRWAGLAGSAVTVAGMVATGSRGAWIGSASLVGVVVAVAVVRAVKQRDRAAVRRFAVLAVVMALALGAVWLAAGDAITRRYKEGREEIRKALVQGDYNTWTGARIYMLQWAWAEFASHPVRGVGAGGYQKWALEHRRPDEPYAYIHLHAHSTWAHIPATTGLIGLGLFMAVIAMGLRGGIWMVRDRLGTYAAGPGFALVGLMLAGMTDVVHLNGQTSALMYVLLGLCIWPRPKEEALPDLRARAWGRPFPRGLWR